MALDDLNKAAAMGGDEDGSAVDSAEAKDPYENLEEISKRIDNVLSVDKFQRTLFESEWFRNVLFYVGQQWIIREKQRWRPKALPLWYPKAQTNKFAEKANDLISTIMQGRAPIRYVPATGDPEDAATAEVGERVREVIYSEAKIDDKEAELATWLVLTGNVFLIPYYDLDEKHGMSTLPMNRCNLCQSVAGASDLAETQGMCPTCQDLGHASTSFSPATDPTGAPMVEQFPVGALSADIVSPFEIRLDHRITTFDEQRRFVRVRRYDLDYAKEKWPDYKDQISASGEADNSEYYLDVLSQVTGSFGASGSTGSGSAAPGDKKKPKVTVYELFDLPSEEFSEGIKAVRIGQSASTVVEAGPLPSKYGAGVRQGQYFLPLVHFGFDTIPGRLWKKTRMDDLIPLQIFRNTIEANLRLTIQRMGNGIWLNPKGSGADIITGEPGQNLTYNPVSLGGTSFAKPERVPAELSNIQPLIIMINKIDDSMERVAGTFFLQGGDTPPGVTAASALAYLGERAQKSMSPFVREWAKGWKRFEELALEIARENWDDERIRVIAGKNKKWQVEKFASASLQGAVNMEIDYQSMFPKSQATERATLSQLVQFGIINPQDPEQNYRILQKFGQTDMKGSVDLDMQEAVKESDRFLTKDEQPELVPMVQNSVVHLMQHNDFAKTDEFKELEPAKKQMWYAHIQATVADIVARQVAFSSIGVDPNNPALSEMGSAEAQAAAAATMAQGGGAPNGAEAPDPRLDENGMKKPLKPGQPAPQGDGTPDIAMPPGVRNIQTPREVSPDQQAA